MDLKIISFNVNCLDAAVSRAGLTDFLQFHSPDIVALQEVNIGTAELEIFVTRVGYRAFANVDLTEANSRGTAFLWKSDLDVHELTIVQENRLMYLKVGNTSFVNVYAPSGRAKRRERQVFFGETLERLVRSFEHSLPVIMGDFNCVLSNIDAANNPEQKKCPALHQLIRLYVYTDVFRDKFPAMPGYTFLRNNTASRLDRFYIPGELVPHSNFVKIIPAAFSDHLAIQLNIAGAGVWVRQANVKKNRSYWKFNNSVLDHQDFLVNFEDMYVQAKSTQNQHDTIAMWWEDCARPMIVTFLKQFSLMVSRERKQTKRMLYIQLKEALSRGMAGFPEAVLIKRRINQILLVESEGLKVRSRFKENLEKEKASLFHLAREKKMGTKNCIDKLVIAGQETNDAERCEQEVLNFFEPLFNGRHGRVRPFVMDEQVLKDFLTDRVGKLPDHDRDALDQPFTADELKECFKCLPNNRSPGICGLTNEFYKKVYHLISEDYLNFQNDMARNKSINGSMRRGVTRLLPKVQEVPRVDQLRPITMLSVDYSIKSRMMTRRLGPLLEDIIQSGQLCSRKKKNIIFGVHNILSSIEYINQKGLSAAILSFDMDKAFDRCYIPYVCKVLKHMNFSEFFIDIIKDMHADVSTRFIMTKLSDPISLTFSIRQGDPIAMMLYIIYMEPFLLALKEVCLGLRIADFSQADEDYCDDVETIVEDESDFIVIDDIFQRFERCSGALLSRTHKSKVLGLGQWTGRTVWPLQWLQNVQELKIFGFYIKPSYEETLNRNWEVQIEDIRNVLMSFNLRALDTLQQRIDVLQIFVCSRLWYKAQALPLPGRVAGRLEALMTSYLWRGKLEKLALQELFCSTKDGGLGLVDIRSKAEALFIKQSCRMLADLEGRSFKHIKYWIGLYLSDFFPTLRPGAHSETIPKFYQVFKNLITEALREGIVSPHQLEKVRVKEVYRELTNTLPPPKVIYKYDLPWATVWENIHHPVLDVKQRELMFLLVHNILPSRQRLFRLNQVQDDNCLEGDGQETLEHLFCQCRRTQVAWAWMRRKIINWCPSHHGLSDFEMINLVTLEKQKVLDIIWLVANYVSYVWSKKCENNNSNIDLDKFIVVLRNEYELNRQYSQNKVSHGLL